MAEIRQEHAAQTLADQGHAVLSAFVMSIEKDHSSLSIDVKPSGLKEYWETIRNGGSYWRNTRFLLLTMMIEMECQYRWISLCFLQQLLDGLEGLAALVSHSMSSECYLSCTSHAYL